jgi:serine/threonine protein kinase/Leucine-rich repeat (LRR) protein
VTTVCPICQFSFDRSRAPGGHCPRCLLLGAVKFHEKPAGADDGDGFPPSEPLLTPEIEAEFARLKPEEDGAMIGPFKLRERIGEGGFGTVWVADQDKPVRRRVALKIIKMGMDTKEVIARFEQERQALAMMDHPNIATVFEAGATQWGRPYFVMELVRGVRITDYCDTEQLSTPQRVELFITVCQAVQHAHQKGIIHRDLKPSNILVTVNDGKAVPKVIDFGVAKSTQERLTDQTIYTQLHRMIGTPLYMSPEQAELTSIDIDTRSDIYSLGVLLYELLTGHPPIAHDTLARAGLDEVRRLIREVDPPRPSQRIKTLTGHELTTTAKLRHIDPAKLPHALRGDLDWVVMKCLEKDRSRRYDTASGLALDLRRYLQNEVVAARPPTTAYLLGKLIKRHKSAVAAGATVVLALVVGFAVALGQARRANREATRARSAEQRAMATVDELRATAPAFAEQAHALAMGEHFAEAIEKLDYAIKLQPAATEYLLAKADLLQCQLELAEAAGVYRQAVHIQPSLTQAEASARLCDELLAAPRSEQGKLTRESLARLHLAMQQQQRPAAELMPVARLLGEEKKLLFAYWVERLKDLPISAERPLGDRLTVRDDGRLALDLRETKITDFSPLLEAPLAALDLAGLELADLSSLRELDLLELNISKTNVTDLAPLRTMRSLEKLDLKGGKVTDLSPLVGLPIKSLDLGQAPVQDYSPLAQLPLENCYFDGNRIADLSVLEGKPLRELVLLGCNEARHFSAIAGIQTLELLVLPSGFHTLPEEDYTAIGALRRLPKLRQLGTTYSTRSGQTIPGVNRFGPRQGNYANTPASEIFWKSWDIEQTFVPALRQSGLSFWIYVTPAGTYGLEMRKQAISDLSIIKGAPFSEILLIGGEVSDLTPLQGMPLTLLNIPGNPVSDLSPLRGLPLERIFLMGTKVRDLSPLVGLPLKSLFLNSCKEVTDVAPLAKIPTLEHLVVPPSADLEVLRQHPGLKRLGYALVGLQPMAPETTVAQFWKNYDAQAWLKNLHDSGLAVKSAGALADGTWDLDLSGSAIGDLTVLASAKISSLNLADAQAVANLAPLSGLALTKLNLSNTAVTDLSPLQGNRLTSLTLRGTKVTDLSTLRGMPLTALHLCSCLELTDLTPIAECRELKTITLPPKAKDLEFLRALPKLERISFEEQPNDFTRPKQTTAEFWKEYDAGKK